MKITANSIRQGNILVHNGDLYYVTKQPDHTKPGKGGAYVQVEMKNLKHGTKLNERFSSSDTVEKAFLEKKDFEYLYEDNGNLVLMDPTNYEQILLSKDLAGDMAAFLQDGMTLAVEFYGEEPLNISLPSTVILEVVETDPVIKGATATSSFKPAILSNGVRVMVPPYLVTGEKIVVKTEDATYVERAK